MTIVNLVGGGGKPTLQSKSVVPSSIEQVITADAGYDGLSQVIVAGDSKLLPENIMAGVTIFGVTGTYGW